MDTERSANADVYRKATDTASAECREIQAEILSLEARVIGLHAREASLIALMHTLDELLPASQDAPLLYVPAFSVADVPQLQPRSAADGDFRYRGASGAN
jgi:hypothetical protein